MIIRITTVQNRIVINEMATDATHTTHSESKKGPNKDTSVYISNEDRKNSIETTHLNTPKSLNKLEETGMVNDNDLTDKTYNTPYLSQRTVAPVAPVADNEKNITKIKRTKAEDVGLPEIPCIFDCGYKDCISFDLSLHYLEYHKPALLKLPYRKGIHGISRLIMQ